ncbi:hypothetical protein [Streptomyces chattanoogensis]|uniref:hypothetical protein n=1 Tax=Streptomyces chattanoogensis TaxID=66876 RepID=UPI0005D81C7D|nr:hypothetical protein T261_5531 [Streptomyces lydicus]
MRAFGVAVGVAAVTVLLSGCSGSSDGPDRTEDSAGSGAGRVSVRFTVTSNLPLKIAMTGISGSAGHTQEFANVAAPWSKTVTVEKGRYPSMAVAPVKVAGKGEVRCEMRVDGKLVDEDSGKGTGSSLVLDCGGAV